MGKRLVPREPLRGKAPCGPIEVTAWLIMRGASPPHPRSEEPKPGPPNPLQQGGLYLDHSTDSCFRWAESWIIACRSHLPRGMYTRLWHVNASNDAAGEPAFSGVVLAGCSGK